ncbi:MAG: DUF2062 domain-containing protein [Rhodospirillaceae bacterium]|nr:DUF2062 domain-containing protein [Rhodospirillaceae bacterium]
MWPRIGWGRTATYYWHRLQRIPGTPGSIAAGFACGLAASMSPAVGTHVIVGMILAYALRSSLVASVIGTLLINPWTAPPVWFSTYYTGAVILGWDEYGHAGVAEFVDMFVGLSKAVIHLDFPLFMSSVMPIFWPMLVGSLPVAIVVGFSSYLILTPILTKLQERRLHKRTKQVEGGAVQDRDSV